MTIIYSLAVDGMMTHEHYHTHTYCHTLTDTHTHAHTTHAHCHIDTDTDTHTHRHRQTHTHTHTHTLRDTLADIKLTLNTQSGRHICISKTHSHTLTQITHTC
jgi:hypothetical protein